MSTQWDYTGPQATGTRRRRLAASAGIAALAVASTSAMTAEAQTTPPQTVPVQATPAQPAAPPDRIEAAAPAAGSVGEVVVTGTRIQATGMKAVTPTTVLSQQVLADIAPGNVSQAVTQMPQFFNNTQPTTSGPIGGALGATTVNLRGLGTNRTLTLLNGRRMVPFNQTGTVDISAFPQALVQRVDVVTGGASAAYGTDAVAGVVNFVLNNKFEGVDARVQGGMSSRGDNGNGSLNLAFGHQVTPKLHVLGSVDYNHNDEISSYKNRDWFQSWGTISDPTDPTRKRLLVRPDVVSTAYTCGGLINQPRSALNGLEFLEGGATAPFRFSTLGTTNGQGAQSIAPQYGGGSGCDVRAQQERANSQSVVPRMGRVTAYGYADYELTDNAKLFLQGLYAHTDQVQNGNSSIMQGTLGATIYSGNPYLPANVQSIMTSEGLPSFGYSRYGTAADVQRGRIVQRNDTLSLTTGFEATVSNGLLSGWKVNGYYQFGTNTNDQVIHNFVRIDRIYQALDAVRDPGTGAIVCNAALRSPAQYGDCVPINLFGPGRASQAALNYIEGPDRTTHTIVTEHDFEVAASGPIAKGWAGQIDGAFGVDYRNLSLDSTVKPDGTLDKTVPFNNPALGIRGIPTTSQGLNQVYQFASVFGAKGTYDVKEVFAEVRAPLVSDRPGFQQVDLDLAARWADYSGSGGVWAYKAGLSWTVIDQVRLRSTYSRDVRAASLQERFNNQGAGGGVSDPFLNNLNYTPTIYVGGNPNVRPELSDTVTAGVVYQPTWLRGLQASVDWYKIEIKDAIGQLTAQNIVNQCFGGVALACSFIQRDPSTGQIRYIFANYINLSSLKASGIDMEVDHAYRGRLFGVGGDESVTTRVLATYLNDRSTTTPGALPTDTAGDIGAGFPKWRAQASVTYGNGPFKVFVREQYIGDGALSYNYTPGSPNNTTGASVDDNHVPETWYTDLHFTYTLPTSMKWDIYFNIDNLFDRPPPVAPSFSQQTGTTPTNLGLYDQIGRRFVMGTHLTF